MNSSESENLFNLTACKKVEFICQPLFNKTRIIAFLYSELYSDGSGTVIGTNYDYLKSSQVNYGHTDEIYTDSTVLDFNNVSEPEGMQYSLKQYLTDRGRIQIKFLSHGNELCLIKKNTSHYEIYRFYASTEHSDMHDYYLDLLPLLRHFCIYFRHKAATLIIQSRKKKDF